jgi:hypothetical protein
MTSSLPAGIHVTPACLALLFSVSENTRESGIGRTPKNLACRVTKEASPRTEKTKMRRSGGAGAEEGSDSGAAALAAALGNDDDAAAAAQKKEELRQRRRARLSSSREIRLKYLTGERDTHEPKEGEKPLPPDFAKLPTGQPETPAAGGAGGAANGVDPLAQLLGGAGGAGAAGLSPEKLQLVRKIALLRRVVIFLVGFAVAVWPASRADSTPASRLWMHLIPLFVVVQLAFRRLHHFLNLAPPGLSGAMFALKVAATDFAVVFAMFWLSTQFLRELVADYFFNDAGDLDADEFIDDRQGVVR